MSSHWDGLSLCIKLLHHINMDREGSYIGSGAQHLCCSVYAGVWIS